MFIREGFRALLSSSLYASFRALSSFIQDVRILRAIAEFQHILRNSAFPLRPPALSNQEKEMAVQWWIHLQIFILKMTLAIFWHHANNIWSGLDHPNWFFSIEKITKLHLQFHHLPEPVKLDLFVNFYQKRLLEGHKSPILRRYLHIVDWLRCKFSLFWDSIEEHFPLG